MCRARVERNSQVKIRYDEPLSDAQRRATSPSTHRGHHTAQHAHLVQALIQAGHQLAEEAPPPQPLPCGAQGQLGEPPAEETEGGDRNDSRARGAEDRQPVGRQRGGGHARSGSAVLGVVVGRCFLRSG